MARKKAEDSILPIEQTEADAAGASAAEPVKPYDLSKIPILDLGSGSGSLPAVEPEIPPSAMATTAVTANQDEPPADASIPDEYPEELAAQEPPEPELTERQKFYALKFNKLDRYLTPPERAEWNSIYASYRGRSALHGVVLGVDPLRAMTWDRPNRIQKPEEKLCAIIVPYRIPIFISEDEMWISENEKPDYVMESVTGANLDFIINKVDREGNYATASRRMAIRARRYYFTHRPALCTIGARLSCKLLSVGPRRCLVEFFGYDISLTQREISYTAIPDLRLKYHPGIELPCIFKGFDPETKLPVISVKETEVNPFDGAVFRHPIGCRRMAQISGKYGGGVFCNLPDATVLMCDYSYQHEDSDFMVGDTVIVVVQNYNMDKKQIYGKILSKW